MIAVFENKAEFDAIIQAVDSFKGFPNGTTVTYARWDEMPDGKCYVNIEESVASFFDGIETVTEIPQFELPE